MHIHHNTLLITLGLMMIVPRLMLGGVRSRVGHVFGAESDILPLCSPGGALVLDPMGKAELLNACMV